MARDPLTGYVKCGSVSNMGERIEAGIALAPRYHAARWRWFDSGIPSAAQITKAIGVLCADCRDSDWITTGGLCVKRDGASYALLVDKRLANAPSESPRGGRG